jgi:hypothetical protein
MKTQFATQVRNTALSRGGTSTFHHGRNGIGWARTLNAQQYIDKNREPTSDKPTSDKPTSDKTTSDKLTLETTTPAASYLTGQPSSNRPLSSNPRTLEPSSKQTALIKINRPHQIRLLLSEPTDLIKIDYPHQRRLRGDANFFTVARWVFHKSTSLSKMTATSLR